MVAHAPAYLRNRSLWLMPLANALGACVAAVQTLWIGPVGIAQFFVALGLQPAFHALLNRRAELDGDLRPDATSGCAATPRESCRPGRRTRPSASATAGWRRWLGNIIGDHLARASATARSSPPNSTATSFPGIRMVAAGPGRCHGLGSRAWHRRTHPCAARPESGRGDLHLSQEQGREACLALRARPAPRARRQLHAQRHRRERRLGHVFAVRSQTGQQGLVS